jgi:hypothetical protein
MPQDQNNRNTEIIIFFTQLDKLRDLDIEHDWHMASQPVMVGKPGQTKQVWMVSDKVIRQSLEEMILQPSNVCAVFFVYHNLPDFTFRKTFKRTLESANITVERAGDYHVQESNSLYEMLRTFPDYTDEEFEQMKKKICSNFDLTGKMLNLFNKPEHIFEKQVDISSYPEEMQEIFHRFTEQMTPSNFRDLLKALKRELWDWVDGRNRQID